MGCVYRATNTIDGTIYIGATRRTIRQRMTTHKSAALAGSGRPLAWAIREYGFAAFTWEVLREVDEAELGRAEIEAISEARAAGKRLYNVAEGGLGGTRGISPSAETRAKIGAAHRGKRVSAEARARMSEAGKARPKKPKAPPKPKVDRHTVFVDGKTIEQLAAEAGMSERGMRNRVARNGIATTKRITTTFEGKPLKDWAAELGVNYYTVLYRLRKFGSAHLPK